MSGELVRRDLPDRRGLPERQLPSQLREAILAAVRLLLEVLPPQVELRLEFGADVEHIFGRDGYVHSSPRPKDIRLEAHAEAPVAGEEWNLIAGGTVIGRVVDRDGELDILLTDWQVDYTRAF